MVQKPDQHLQARNLYFQTDLSQQRISELLDVNRKTLYLWIKEGGWKAAKYAANNAPSVLAGQYYAQLGALNKHILHREERPYPTQEESDIIRKLTVTIKHLGGRQTVTDSIELFENFTNRLMLVDQDLNKKLILHMDRYIKDLSQKDDFATNDDAADREFEQWLAQQAAQEQAPKTTLTPSPGNGATGASVPTVPNHTESLPILTNKQNDNTPEAPKKDENGASKEPKNMAAKPQSNIIPLPSPASGKPGTSSNTIALGKTQQKTHIHAAKSKKRRNKRR